MNTTFDPGHDGHIIAALIEKELITKYPTSYERSWIETKSPYEVLVFVLMPRRQIGISVIYNPKNRVVSFSVPSLMNKRVFMYPDNYRNVGWAINFIKTKLSEV